MQEQEIIREVIDYYAEPTPLLFHHSPAFVRAIMGPVGSGKSSACVEELKRLVILQTPFRKKRKSRIAVIRASYPRLRDTTLKTFLEWFPEGESIEGYKMIVNRQAPMVANLTLPLADGTTVEAEFIFIALDDAKDVHKLRSLELTFAWMNEASEVSFEIFKMLRGRMNRFPAVRRGGFTRSCIIMDTNPPPMGHWYQKLAEVTKPDKEHAEFFKQPPALIRMPNTDPVQYGPNTGQMWNEETQEGIRRAENIANLAKGFQYYFDQLPGSDPEWIKVFVEGEYGILIDGTPVWHEYRDDFHCSKEPLELLRGLPLVIGLDFGRTPSCEFTQLAPGGQLRVIDEIYTEDCGIREFIESLLLPKLTTEYHGMTPLIRCDPAGGSPGQLSDTVTLVGELRRFGLVAEPAETNKWLPRREAVAQFLTKVSDGKPGLLISPKCVRLREGFQGKYYRKRIKGTVVDDIYKIEPDKNSPWSHPHDALQYAALYFTYGGSGGDYSKVQASQQRRPVVYKSRIPGGRRRVA